MAAAGRGRRLPRAAILAALAVACAAAASGCYSQTVHFYTRFNQPGALAAGAPVVSSLGMPIGTVASVSPTSSGAGDVTLDVNRNDAYNVHQDSIMVLSDNPSGPTVDVMSPNPSSAPADPGATIDGASNQQDANALLAAKNLAAMAPAMAMILSASGSSAAAGAGALNVSPALALLQAQIAMIQAQYLAAGASGAAALAQQLAAVNRSAATLEQQLVAAGHSAQANQLRQQIGALARTFSTPPGASAPAAPSAPSPAPTGPSAPAGAGPRAIPPSP